MVVSRYIIFVIFPNDFGFSESEINWTGREIPRDLISDFGILNNVYF